MKLSLLIALGLVGQLVGQHAYEPSPVSRPSYSSTSVFWPRPQQPDRSTPDGLSSTTSLPPWRGSSREDLRDPDGDSIVGVAGHDYPVFAKIPNTNFSCSDYPQPGYYVDAQAQCQVFHICQKNGGRVSFLCPNGTVFNQQYFVCDWWYNVDCGSSPSDITSPSAALEEGPADEQVGNFSTVSERPLEGRQKVASQSKVQERPPLSQAFF